MSDQATSRAKKSLQSAFVLGGVQLFGALLLTIAHKQLGWIDGETTTRALMVLFGLCLAAMGNAMPKQLDGPPSQTAELAAVRQAISRVGGWAMVIGGLIWTLLWIFAPRDIAEVGSVAAVGTATIIMAVFAIWRYRTRRS